MEKKEEHGGDVQEVRWGKSSATQLHNADSSYEP